MNCDQSFFISSACGLSRKLAKWEVFQRTATQSQNSTDACRVAVCLELSLMGSTEHICTHAMQCFEDSSRTAGVSRVS